MHCGDDAAKAEYLPGIASGETIATLAFTEANGRWDESGITMEASGSGDSWTLTGEKMYVLDGTTASLIIVAARTAVGVSLFAVDGDAAGLTRESLSTMDQTRKQARLTFADTPARSSAPRAPAGTRCRRRSISPPWRWPPSRWVAPRSASRWPFSTPRTGSSSAGPIGSFQAIKHKCADMLLEVESAKSAAYYAGWCASELNDELPSVASLAKSYCSEAYFHTTAENIQIHGGIGFTWEHPAHLYFKRAKSSELLFGDPTYHRELLAQRIGI